jgi:predicted negative regulator of RcsB-dependent stress response
MATTTHRRISRKELKQPDEFITIFDQIGDFIADNALQVVIGAVIVVVAIAAAFAFSFYEQHQRGIVSGQFYGAINALGDKRYAEAEQGFSRLAEQSPNSQLGHLAQFYLASTYLAENEPAKARDALQAFLQNGGETLFRQMALTQLGVTDEELGAYGNAHIAYVEAAQLDGPEKARAEVGVARTLALQGDHQGAIRAYQRFLTENPFAQQRVEVIEALAQMGATPEGGPVAANSTVAPKPAVAAASSNAAAAKAAASAASPLKSSAASASPGRSK